MDLRIGRYGIMSVSISFVMQLVGLVEIVFTFFEGHGDRVFLDVLKLARNMF